MMSTSLPTTKGEPVSDRKIRIALIGLNAPFRAGTATGTSWAADAHIPYLIQSDKYEIVALQNSSVERAEQAIKAYKLDGNRVRAYGTAEDVAKDPNVDLVVSSIRVDRHGQSVIPSIEAGKAVFVEWPLEANYKLAGQLYDLVQENNVRNVVGMQGAFSPVVPKLKELIANGSIGEVESSTVVAKAVGGQTMPSHLDYFVDKEVGGNILTIAFGHSLEFISAVLGEVKSHTSLLLNQYGQVDIVNTSSGEVTQRARENTVPNQIVFNAVLDSGVLLTYKLHGGPRLPPPQADTNTPPRRLPLLEWRIFGSKGEIRVNSYATWSINSGSPYISLELASLDTGGQVVQVDMPPDELEHLPMPARNIGRLYEAFAVGRDYPDFKHALGRHKVIEEIWRGYERGQTAA